MRRSCLRFLGLGIVLAACGAPGSDKAGLEEQSVGVTELPVWQESSWREANVSRPSSAHPYQNNSRRQWTIVAPSCVQAVRVRFARIEVEEGYDAVVIRDGAGRLVQRISGTYEDFVSEPVLGNVVKIQLRSDWSIVGYGFDVASVEAVDGEPICAQVVFEPCALGSVDVNPPKGLCQCPPQPTCEPLESFSASLVTAGGFAGTGAGHELTGDGRVFSLRVAPAQTDKTHVADADPAQVQELARLLITSGFFSSESGVSGESCNLISSFTASFRGTTRTVSWPAGAPSGAAAKWARAIGLFSKAVACDVARSERAATCIAGYACSEAGTCEEEGCFCPMYYDPVCGSDGNTYGNACEAGCAGVSVAREGECQSEPNCVCTEEYAPVCGSDGNTYGNACKAGCAGVSVAHEGECQSEPGCFCPMYYDPVCGEDGRTYGNTCEAGCAGVGVAHEGECGSSRNTCGGIAGEVCSEGERCRYAESTFTPPYPDAQGTCVPENYCDAPTDCTHLPHIMCAGQWSCENNVCAYHCVSEPLETWSRYEIGFGSPSPYENDSYLAWRLAGPSDAKALRVPFASFDLEEGYDFVILYDAAWNEVHRYTGSLGAFVSEPVEGNTAYLVFSSDGSVTARGFRADGIEFLR